MNIITLSNGKRVGNFSSPHPFTFEDGSILPAVSEHESERLKIHFIEEDMGDGDISLSFGLSLEVIEEMFQWDCMQSMGKVDIVFCPLPMITCLREKGYNIKNTPFRAIRMVDRFSKLVSITKQCI